MFGASPILINLYTVKKGSKGKFKIKKTPNQNELSLTFSAFIC